jgi:DNA-binding NtrC family response regulator
MSQTRNYVLIVDDEKSMCDVLDKGLKQHGFDVRCLTSPLDAVRLLREEDFDVLVTDLNMKEMNGLQLCTQSLAARPDVPVVVITAFGSLETAIGAIRAGAYDFITKPFEIEIAAVALERAASYKRLRGDLKRLKENARQAERFDELIGNSPIMHRVYDLLQRVEQSDVTVLVTGESGTGKELVAKALHRRGCRCDGPFVAVNCAALPESLLESELFGHVQGAFTDAKTERTGLFIRANKGTLFLDEIDEIPLGMQAKLLRALQNRVVRPVGSDSETPFDARIIAATNRDLVSAVEEGRFREDLYFRLNVLEIDVPPLRARGNDVLLLSQQQLERFSLDTGKAIKGIDPEAAKKLLAYDWPGNVRELQNCIERAVALTRFDRITVDDLPARIRNYNPSNYILVATDDPTNLISLEEVERRYILRVLESVNGHRAAAARILGLDRKTLYRKLDRWGMGDIQKR